MSFLLNFEGVFISPFSSVTNVVLLIITLTFFRGLPHSVFSFMDLSRISKRATLNNAIKSIKRGIIRVREGNA